MQDRFNALLADTRDSLSTLVDVYTSGYLDAETFGDRMAALLEDAHTDAVVIGRQHAGDDAPQDTDDRKLGEQVVDGESEFLAAFVKDLSAGRYEGEDGLNSDAISQRAGMYANRLVGTANEAWTLAQDEGAQITWNLGSGNSCPDCEAFAAGSPYEAGTLDAYPGSCDSVCLGNCNCYLTSSGGGEGFRLPDTDEE